MRIKEVEEKLRAIKRMEEEGKLLKMMMEELEAFREAVMLRGGWNGWC